MAMFRDSFEEHKVKSQGRRRRRVKIPLNEGSQVVHVIGSHGGLGELGDDRCQRIVGKSDGQCARKPLSKSKNWVLVQSAKKATVRYCAK